MSGHSVGQTWLEFADAERALHNAVSRHVKSGSDPLQSPEVHKLHQATSALYAATFLEIGHVPTFPYDSLESVVQLFAPRLDYEEPEDEPRTRP